MEGRTPRAGPVRGAVPEAAAHRSSCQRWSAVPLSSYCTTWALSAVDIRSTPSTLSELWLRMRYQPPPSGTSCHRWSAVSLSSNWTTWALFAVDMRSTPSTLPECWLRMRYQPSPLATRRHRWSAVPVSPNWTTWALFAVDMPSTPSTLPELRLAIRYQPSASHGVPSGLTVGKDVIRSRAAPIG